MNEKPIVAAIVELTKSTRELVESNRRVERILADIDQALEKLPRQPSTGAPLVKIT